MGRWVMRDGLAAFIPDAPRSPFTGDLRAVDLWWSRELEKIAGIAGRGGVRELDDDALVQVEGWARQVTDVVLAERCRRYIR